MAKIKYPKAYAVWLAKQYVARQNAVNAGELPQATSQQQAIFTPERKALVRAVTPAGYIANPAPPQANPEATAALGMRRQMDATQMQNVRSYTRRGLVGQQQKDLAQSAAERAAVYNAMQQPGAVEEKQPLSARSVFGGRNPLQGESIFSGNVFRE